MLHLLLSGGASNACYNTSPGVFTATGSGGSGTYTYLWYLGGVSTGITTQTYDPGNLTLSTNVYCAVTSCGTSQNSAIICCFCNKCTHDCHSYTHISLPRWLY